jgi:hypothetical protein
MVFRSISHSALCMIIALCILPLTMAQFGNFFQGGFPFGGGGGGEQHQQQQRPRREHKGWSEMESGEWTFRYL